MTLFWNSIVNFSMDFSRINPSSQKDLTVRQSFWREEEGFEDLGEGCATLDDHCWDRNEDACYREGQSYPWYPLKYRSYRFPRKFLLFKSNKFLKNLSFPFIVKKKKNYTQPFPPLAGGSLHRWGWYPRRGDQRPCAEDFEGSTDRPQQSRGEFTDSSTSDRRDTQRKYRYGCL